MEVQVGEAVVLAADDVVEGISDDVDSDDEDDEDNEDDEDDEVDTLKLTEDNGLLDALEEEAELDVKLLGALDTVVEVREAVLSL